MRQAKRKYSKQRNYLLCITTKKIKVAIVWETKKKKISAILPRHLQDVTSSRHLQDVLPRSLQDFFKTYQHVKLFLLTSLRDVFNTFLRLTAKTMIYRMIGLGHTSEKFMVSVQNLKE